MNDSTVINTLASIVQIDEFKNTLDEVYIKNMGWKVMLFPYSSGAGLDDDVCNVSREVFDKDLIYFTYDGAKKFSPVYTDSIAVGVEFSLYKYIHQSYKYEGQPQRTSEYTIVTNSQLDFIYAIDSYDFSMIAGPEEFIRKVYDDDDYMEEYLDELESWNSVNQKKGLMIHNKYDSLGLIIK